MFIVRNSCYIGFKESNYNEYEFEIGGKKILAVHSKVDPTKGSLEKYLKSKTEIDVICGDFNLTKSKSKNNISEVVVTPEFSKIHPEFIYSFIKYIKMFINR